MRPLFTCFIRFQSRRLIVDAHDDAFRQHALYAASFDCCSAAAYGSREPSPGTTIGGCDAQHVDLFLRPDPVGRGRRIFVSDLGLKW